MRVAVFLREAEAFREMRPNRVAVEILDHESAPVHLRADVMRDRRLSGAREPREPEGEAAAPIGLGFRMLVRVDVLTQAAPS